MKIETKFPVHIDLKGDDFSFEDEISLEMVGHIIGYIAREKEEQAKRFHKQSI